MPRTTLSYICADRILSFTVTSRLSYIPLALFNIELIEPIEQPLRIS